MCHIVYWPISRAQNDKLYLKCRDIVSFKFYFVVFGMVWLIDAGVSACPGSALHCVLNLYRANLHGGLVNVSRKKIVFVLLIKIGLMNSFIWIGNLHTCLPLHR